MSCGHLDLTSASVDVKFSRKLTGGSLDLRVNAPAMLVVASWPEHLRYCISSAYKLRFVGQNDVDNQLDSIDEYLGSELHSQPT